MKFYTITLFSISLIAFVALRNLSATNPMPIERAVQKVSNLNLREYQTTIDDLKNIDELIHEQIVYLHDQPLTLTLLERIRKACEQIKDNLPQRNSTIVDVLECKWDAQGISEEQLTDFYLILKTCHAGVAYLIPVANSLIRRDFTPEPSHT